MNRRSLPPRLAASAFAAPPAALLLAALLLLALPARAQFSAPAPAFNDTSTFKPPAGAKVAILEYEDLECPACAHAFPIVHAAADHYKIPLMRHDFPLPQHIWSFDAAVTARYLQDKVSAKIADEFRGAVFAAQLNIASKDDLENFTRRFFQSHNLARPFVLDPQGTLTSEVKADYNLGQKIGLHETPTIIVLTARNWTQIKDINQLDATIDEAIADTRNTPAVTKNPVHSTPRHVPAH